MSEDPRYPIGKFARPDGITSDMRRDNIKAIKELAGELACAIHGLEASQMDTEYRPGGWTVRQVIHHVADSHLNAFCRFKLALTEDGPTIKPYDEAAWANLPDSTMDAEVSLQLIEGLHKRFASLLDGMSDTDFGRTLVHPETGTWTLDEMLALYAWHSKHHTAHVTALRAKEGW